MNFYDFHIGDYTSRTAHLEPMEDLAYRRMLDLYYTRECALPEDVEQIARLIRMRGHVAEITSVLKEFFTNNDGDGWIHFKCEEVINAAQAKRNAAKSSAAARWSKTDKDANAMRTQCERTTYALPPDCESNAPSPSPTTHKEKKPAASPWLTVPELIADGLSQNLSAEWLAHRRSRKAKLTRLAWDGFKAEVVKAGWQLDDAVRKAIARNWTGFEADWVKPAGFQAVAAVTVPSLAADKTAELLKADEEHRAEVARQRALRQQEKAA